MRSLLIVSVIVTSIMLCGYSVQSATTAPKPNVGKTSDLVLPSWTPKHPSPEFLRAAKIIRPVPDEILQQFAKELAPGNKTLPAAMQRYAATFPAAYEFIGSLSDTQLAMFMKPRQLVMQIPKKISKEEAAKAFAAQQKWMPDARLVDDKVICTLREIRIPIKALTQAQRAALDRWMDAFDRATKGLPRVPGQLTGYEYRVGLYKMGAKEDFSNVDVALSDQGTRLAWFKFWVKTGGKEKSITSLVGQIAAVPSKSKKK
jgi:hypothetical protein